MAHFEKQLQQGKIRIGVSDYFGSNSTHGVRVEERILSQMPQELRGRVEIVRYDVAGLNGDDRARVISPAANDAKDKNLLALSVSGGINVERHPRVLTPQPGPRSAPRADGGADPVP